MITHLGVRFAGLRSGLFLLALFGVLGTARASVEGDAAHAPAHQEHQAPAIPPEAHATEVEATHPEPPAAPPVAPAPSHDEALHHDAPEHGTAHSASDAAAGESVPSDAHATPTDAHAPEGGHAGADSAHAPEAAEHALAGSVITPEEIVSLLRIGAAKSEQQDWASAQLAYSQVLAGRRVASGDQLRSALLGLARAYRGERQLTKAVAIYERYVRDFPSDQNLPTVYLELGRCLRALGAHRLAIARFYSVINSTLKLPEEGQDSYRQLARTAQFEIAETYFLAGDYQQAERFFSRLRLLDLAPADRARAAFKAAYAVQLRGEHESAVTQLRAFLSLFPDGEDAPEARYLLSLSLRRLGRAQESLAAVLELLQEENARNAPNSAEWTRWQRKTGNQLANEFYEQGDITSALTIYRCLEELGGPPDWLLPVRYQIGLCQERLKQSPLARATYQSILDQLGAKTGDAGSQQSALVRDIAAMAAWRLQHLDWLDTLGERLAPFPSSDHAELPAPADDANPPVSPPSLPET